MTTLPSSFPWQVLLALGFALLFFALGGLVTLAATGRTMKARRRARKRGGVIDLTGASLAEPWDFPEPPTIRDRDAA